MGNPPGVRVFCGLEKVYPYPYPLYPGYKYPRVYLYPCNALFGSEKERTRHAGALAEDEDGVVGRGTEGADVPLGAPAVVPAQPECLVEQRADGAGLVEAAPGAEAGREGVRGRRDDEGVDRRRGWAGLGGAGEIREDVGGIERIRERRRGFKGRGKEDGLVRGRVGEEGVVGECEVEGRGGIGERDLEECVV